MKLTYSKKTLNENSQFFESKVLLIIRHGRYSSLSYVDTAFINTAVTSLKTQVLS